MINIPQIPENINHEFTPNKEEIFDTLNEESINFFRTLEFSWLNYEARREKVEDVTDEIVDLLYKEKIDRRNVLMNLLKEVIKNSADHSGSDMNIEIILHKYISNKKIQLRFSLYDEWPWLPHESEDIKRFFDTGETIENRKKKGNSNYWVWLGMIKAVAETCNIDLVLHNWWKTIHLNDLGLQKDVKPQKGFLYEGLGTFDIIEK